jgi:riboflavin transporter FmnP
MLLGILVFGNSSEPFGSMSSIFITIYSVMNCDSIWQTFNDTNSSENSQAIGTIYVTIIFIIFSYLMMRLILAMVESLYFYFRLYSNLRRKRLLYRKKHLLVDDQTATTPTLKGT